MTSEFYTVAEFAKLLNISRQTLMKAIHEGRVNAIRIGSSIKSPFRIPKEQIDKLLALTEQEIQERK